jgi:hypothetical protein
MANKPKLNVHDDAMATTASAELTREALKEYVATDARGRLIKIVKPGILKQSRLIKILGENAKNEVYLGMMTVVLHVVQIDDDQVLTPNNERELEALLGRLDDDGFQAVMQAVETHFTPPDPDAVKESIKN